MLDPEIHVALALAMVALGAGAAWIMLEAFGGRTPKEKSRRRAALHRALGRSYAVIYLVLLVSMTRMALRGPDLGATESVHAALGLSILPILVLKILIVRRWQPLHRFLPLFGSAVFALTFVTVGLGLLATHTSEEDAGGTTPIASLPDHPGRDPFVRYCAQCHALARPLGLAASRRPSASEWTALVGTMRERAASRGRSVWTDAEGALIVEFLGQVGQGSAAGAPAGAGGDSDDAGDDRGRGRGRGGRDDR